MDSKVVAVAGLWCFPLLDVEVEDAGILGVVFKGGTKDARGAELGPHLVDWIMKNG